MKTLILVRHAKSDKNNPALSDMDHPLTAQGEADASRMAQRLADSTQRVDALVSSPARRALSTADIFSAQLQLPVQQNPRLYSAEIESLRSVVRQLDDRISAVALFGHNPGFSELIRYLTEEPYADLPTSGIAVIDLPVPSWRHVSGGNGILKNSLCPNREELGFQNFMPDMGRAHRFRIWRIEHARTIFLVTVFVIAMLLILGAVALVMHLGVNHAVMPQQGSSSSR